MKTLIFSLFVVANMATVAVADSFKITWPTGYTIYENGKLYEGYIQPSEPGDVQSGLFGCARDGGRRFNEGIDIKATQRDWTGEPTDVVHSILPGKVVYINRAPGRSAYGRYVVIEHREPADGFYSLYAHLRSVSDTLQAGDTVTAGQEIGVLGRSTADNSISQDQAHLHLELGMRISNDFQSWYDRQKFDDRNYHGNWNDMNLLGIDMLDYLKQCETGKIKKFSDYLLRQPLAVSVKVQTRRIPDFVRRYPFVLAEPVSPGDVQGWQINFNWYGIPMAWRPLNAKEVAPMGPNQVEIVYQDAKELTAHPCNDLVQGAWDGAPLPGKRLKTILGILFGM